MSTQFLGAMLFGVYLFFLCVSAGFWYFGKQIEEAGLASAANNPLLQRSMNFTQLNENFNSSATGIATGGGFNTAFSFGDFARGITEFFNVVSGGYMIKQVTLLGFPNSFVLIMQVIVVGFGAAGALIYYISGRA